jgi:hypothetical protein
VVTIRTFARRRLSLADLIDRGTLDPATARLLEAMVAAGIAIVVSGGTGSAWANPPPAETPRRLILKGGFVVDDGRDRRLEERARVLGFESLRGYLQARCDTGHSIPRIATELGVGDWQVQAALTQLGVWLAPRPQRLAAQRRRYTEQRIAARVAQLGFADVEAYLVDRVVQQGWLLAEVAAELGAHRVTVRRLLGRHGIRRVRRTPAERAAADRGRRVQAVGWQARRAARLAELGIADLAGYLLIRYVEQGWSVKRMRVELGVGRRWLVGGAGAAGAATLNPGSDRPAAGRVSGRNWAAAWDGAGARARVHRVLEAAERGGSWAWHKWFPSGPGMERCSPPGRRVAFWYRVVQPLRRRRVASDRPMNEPLTG